MLLAMGTMPRDHIRDRARRYLPRLPQTRSDVPVCNTVPGRVQMNRRLRQYRRLNALLSRFPPALRAPRPARWFPLNKAYPWARSIIPAGFVLPARLRRRFVQKFLLSTGNPHALARGRVEKQRHPRNMLELSDI